MVLYNATDGPNWVNNRNWLSEKPISEWYGISDDAHGRVTEILLYDNNLKGSIPPELGHLSVLRLLNLQRNRLTGPIPPEVGNLSNLHQLQLRGNQLTGTISPDLGKPLGAAPTGPRRQPIDGGDPAGTRQPLRPTDAEVRPKPIDGADPSGCRQPLLPGDTLAPRQPTDRGNSAGSDRSVLPWSNSASSGTRGFARRLTPRSKHGSGELPGQAAIRARQERRRLHPPQTQTGLRWWRCTRRPRGLTGGATGTG